MLTNVYRQTFIHFEHGQPVGLCFHVRHLWFEAQAFVRTRLDLGAGAGTMNVSRRSNFENFLYCEDSELHILSW